MKRIIHDVTSNRIENSIDKKICVVHILGGIIVKGISLHFIEIHPNFHMSYGILLRKYKNIMITL
jgi:hypothetical protein